MKKLDERGTSALEFTLVSAPLFGMVFIIIQLGFYAMTIQSLQTLANAEERACFISFNGPSKSISSCAGPGKDYLSDSQKQTASPFLFAGGLSPTVAITTVTVSSKNYLQITVSQSNFSTVAPFLGPLVGTPTVTTLAPY